MVLNAFLCKVNSFEVRVEGGDFIDSVMLAGSCD